MAKPRTAPADPATAAVEAAIARYGEREPVLRAFAWFDADRARHLARRAPGGALAGLPVGVKDIVDTAGIPTRLGSRLFADRVPDRDATIVERLRAAGAIDVGKTATTEFAYYAPAPTTNPHAPDRTPGGSSAGSAAAVAADVVPLAVGTQTNGSIIRPAAFCGVVGFKPTAGRLPRDGVMELSGTLDTVGGFARSVEGVAALAAVMAGEPLEEWWRGPSADAPRFALVRTSDWDRASAAMRARFEADVEALSWAGAIVEQPALPADLDRDAVEVLGTIMRYEGARSIGTVALTRPDLVTEASLAFFREGLRTDDARYRDALASRARSADAFGRWAARYDAVLTPPAAGEAPGLETTGDPRFCSRWTLVGAPAIAIPTAVGPSGLPLGLQLVGAPGSDARTLAAAAWAERVFAPRRPLRPT